MERSPVSEACRGVLTAVQRLGLDPGDRNLEGVAEAFRGAGSEQADRQVHGSGECFVANDD